MPAKEKKQEIIKKPVEKEEIKGSVKSSALKNKISKFGKSAKAKSFNNFGLSKEERLELFIKNKINSSNRYNGWYITINAFKFAEEIGHHINISEITDIVDKIHKTTNERG